MLSAGARELVELRRAPAVGRPPLARDQALFLEPVECRIEGPFLDADGVGRLLGEPEKPDTPGMLILPANMVETWSDDMLTEPEPEPVAALPGPNGTVPAPAPAANGRTNGAACKRAGERAC